MRLLLNLLVLATFQLQGCKVIAQFLCSKDPPNVLEFENNNSTAARKCFVLTETNQTRCYYALIPDCAATAASDGHTPVVYDLHGRLGCPEDMVTYSGWGKKAVEECFIAIWPDGSYPYDLVDSGCWTGPGGNVSAKPLVNQSTVDCCCRKDGEYLAAEEREDLTFLVKIADDLKSDMQADVNNTVSIDFSRIYLTGHSNGCYASMAMAMQRSDFVAAVCCMSGALLTPPAVDYQPTPIWFLGGTLDSRVSVDGQFNEGSTYVPSQAGGYERFAALNNCTQEFQSEVAVPSMDVPGQLGMMLTRTSHGCVNDANVTWVSLSTAGHMVYQDVGFEFFPPNAAATTVDTTSLAWEACSAHRLSTAPVFPTASPSASTAINTSNPSLAPSVMPSVNPSFAPSLVPSLVPTIESSEEPTLVTSEPPTKQQSEQPTLTTTKQPSLTPTEQPVSSAAVSYIAAVTVICAIFLMVSV